MRYVVCYDMADDSRREDVATLVSGYGPRVQLSVFECELRSREEVTGLLGKLRSIVDPVEDQVRVYPLDAAAVRSVIVVWARTIEERQDFWIVS
jgi:CRISPR-associated protein Cas2